MPATTCGGCPRTAGSGGVPSSAIVGLASVELGRITSRMNGSAAALGYASALAPLLAPLGAIDADGRPRLRGALGATSVPGLWLVGMKPSLTSYFHQARREAKAAARAIRALPGA